MITPTFLLTALVVCLIPGTGVLYTLAVGLGQGRRAAVWAALGCTLGILPHLAAAILGVAALLHASALAFTVVKWLGVGYLLWLGAQALRSGGALHVDPAAQTARAAAIVRRGALLNILNPKLSVFFLALLPPFLTGAPATATAEMLVLGAVFMAMTFATFVLYGLGADLARRQVLARPRVLAWLNRSIAALFGALAARLALERA